MNSNVYLDGGWWGLLLLVVIGIIAFFSLRSAGLLRRKGTSHEESHAEQKPEPKKEPKPEEKKAKVHSDHGGHGSSKKWPVGRIVLWVVLALVILWLVLGGWVVVLALLTRLASGVLDFATESVFGKPQPAAMAAKRQIEYRYVKPKYEPMRQAEICANVPIEVIQAPAGDEWSPKKAVPPGCQANISPSPDSGLYRTRCTSVAGVFPSVCDEYIDVQFQKIASGDTTPLTLKVWFVPLKPIN